MLRVLKFASLIIVVVVLIAASVLYLYVRSEAFDRWVGQQIVAFLEERFAVRVELDRVEVRLRRTQVELHGLRLFSRSFPRPEPALAFDRILVDFSITHFFRPAASLDELHLDRPAIRLLEDANGRLNFSNMFLPDEPRGEGPGFSVTRLAIGQIRLRDGLLVYHDRPFQVDTVEGGLQAQLEFDPAERKYRVESELRQMDLGIDGFRVDNFHVLLHLDYWDDRLQFHSVSLEAPEMSARATGELSLRDARYRFDTEVVTDLTALKEPDFSSVFETGQVQAAGTFRGQGGDFHFEGRLSSPHLRLAGLSFRNLESDVHLTPRQLDVERLITHFYGGTLQAAGQLGLQDEVASRFQVTASGTALRPLLRELNLSEIQTIGSSDFRGEVDWPGLDWQSLQGQGRASYQGDLYPQGIGTQSAEALAFEGHTLVSLRYPSVQLREGRLETSRSAITYQGNIGFDLDYRLDVGVSSVLGQELVDLARASGVVDPEPLEELEIELQGKTELAFQIGGAGTHFDLVGRVETQGVRLRNQPLGDFESRVSLNPRRLLLEEASLRGSGYKMTGTALIPFEPAADAPLRLELGLQEVPLERILLFLETPPPLEGPVTGDLEIVRLDGDRYRGAGRIRVTQPRAYGQALDFVEGSFEIEDQRLRLTEVRGELETGRLQGEGEANLQEGSYRLELTGSGLPLEAIPMLQEQVSVSGRLDFRVRSQGTLEAPQVNLEASLPSLDLRGHSFTDIRLQADSRNETARFKLTKSFEGHPFEVEGEVGLAHPYPLKATLDLERVPVTPYLALLDREELENVDGWIGGKVVLSGPLADPEAFSGTGNFSKLDLILQGYPVHNADPLVARYRDGNLEINPVTFLGSDTELVVGGNLRLTEPRSVNLKVDGTANLLILNTFITPGATSGEVELSTVVSGPLDNPRVVGSADLKDWFLFHPELPVTVFDARGSFKFTANQIAIDSFSARTPYGTLNADGGVFLEGLRPTRWRVNAYGSGLRLEYPENLHSVVDVDLDFLKRERSQLISGAVYVRSADYTQEISLSELIFQATAPLAVAPTTPAGEEVVLDISVEAYQTLRVNNNLADITASGDFTVRGTLENPVILGHIFIDQGELYLENNTYELIRGSINFNNPRRTTPNFNFEAETDIREYTIAVILRGPLDQLKVNFRSDPPLPTPSIVSLLAVRQTQEEIFGADGDAQAGTLALYGAGALLSKSVGERLETRTGRLFGFEKFSIDPFLYGGGRDPGARVTLGKQLTNNLSLTYSTDLSNNQQGQLVIIEYQLASWLTAIGTRDQDGSVAIDFRFKKRF